MNSDPVMPMDLDNRSHDPHPPSSSPLSSLPSSDGFGSQPDSDADVDQASISEDDNFATGFEDEDNDEVQVSTPRKKRTKGCLSSIAVPASVKAAVVKASGGKCWLCNLYGVHIAHVIAKSDKILFEEYRRSGLLHLDSLHNMQNLMHLCGGCHSCFDSRVPVWAFLPTNLADFIAREIEFQQNRASAASRGIALPRPDPCEGKITNLLYGRYMIRDGYIAPHPFVAQPTKRWLGNPVTTILRSASILAGVQRLDPLTQGGIPDDVARNFHHLLYLYGKPAPQVVLTPSLALATSPPDLSDYSAPDSGGQLQPPPPPPGPPGGPPPALALTRENNTRYGKQVVPHNSHRQAATPSGTTSNRNRKLQDWVLGPKMTSNMLIEWRLAGIENARG